MVSDYKSGREAPQYLVKWCGLEYSDSTWEQEEELCRDGAGKVRAEQAVCNMACPIQQRIGKALCCAQHTHTHTYMKGSWQSWCHGLDLALTAGHAA